MLLSFATGAAGSLLFMKDDTRSNLWANISAIIGSTFGIISSLIVLVSGSGFSCNLKSSFPLLSFSIQVDCLCAFFLFLISVISLLCSLYAIGYTRQYYKHYNIGSLGFFYNTFLTGMVFVVSAHNGLFFLVVWEVMSLSSYFLVIFEHKEEKNIAAGSLYFVMTHIGTAFIILAFLLLYKSTGSLDFTIIKDSIGEISPVTKNAVFILALIGFGTKAGIIPLHTWLPSAHPAAPSHVSALMSGVMIKTAIYMLIRIFMEFMPDTPLWWGVVILFVGSISSLFGVLYALSENDLKRLLAFSSIENIGIILLGLGASLVFLALGMKPYAMMALIASLFHTLNHATFKALLFLGAGSVISKTGTRNIEEYGGIIKFLPYTAFFFLIGSMAISALPPFNGFFSEWLTFQSLFSGIKTTHIFIKLIFISAAGSLALTGGLAAACFVRAFGLVFLARPRSERTICAKESSVSLLSGMGVLAALTLLFGFFSGYISALLSKVTKSIVVFQGSEPAVSSNFETVRLQDGTATVSMPGILISLVLALLAITVFVYFLTRRQKVKKGITWDCGTPFTGRMEITATGFSRSLVTIFKGILKPTKQTDIEYHDSNLKYFTKFNITTLGTGHDIYNEYLYAPLNKLITRIAKYLSVIQSGNINAYVLYIIIALITLILLLVV
ncbi:MAG: hydrogenase 4 subunit B [Candidatus Scalindua sp.]|nr:hydrogenase 4 subunit B [Candidatus Scalindua sp.]